jgi:uncharacterized protein
MADRRDWVLVFIGAPTTGSFRTDQIRVMKGLFLLSKEGPSELRDLYTFAPYDYGPFDREVYHDLDLLEIEGLIDAAVVTGSKRRIFRMTPRGEERCAEIRASASPTAIKAIDEVKELVSSMSFMGLLRYVYGRHPDFAVASIVNR